MVREGLAGAGPTGHAGAMSALAALRAATRSNHDAVDAAFGRFDLGEAGDYARFLSAHARALPAVEAVLVGRGDIPAVRPRGALLAADLAALGVIQPDPLPFAPPGDRAEAFGMAYVIDGSRLGGGVLARSVPAGLPRAYLTATHLPGEWRVFGQALEAAAEGEGWVERAIAAARATFDLYAAAAGV